MYNNLIVLDDNGAIIEEDNHKVILLENSTKLIYKQFCKYAIFKIGRQKLDSKQ
jgi:hypothetical protein